MYPYEQNNQPSLKNLAVMAVVFVSIAFFGILSLSTGDVLWFWPMFNEQPGSITVFCYGETVTLQPGQSQFSELTGAFNQSLSGYKNWDSLSLSDETWADYQSHEEMLVLVFHYAQPVRVHSLYKYFSSVDTLIVPLVGRHAQTNAVFGMADGLPGSGSLHMRDTRPLAQYLADQGICGSPLTTSN